ncbi:hypothetical protein EUTSA_v10025648mg [Eutrema salsugineum]|uniref:RRM domain-containing protein n=1 Tax=Eutrema salsugineum TaxID=72664 RepID=V4MGE4_EUTSA|nr:hypothetical protein EUTSA_v10025648mg [Eutrema salsugineum]
MLPDDEEHLFAGLMDDLNLTALPATLDDLKDCDLFVGSLARKHSYGEHPSRTLFVRNINSNVEDSELIALFEQLCVCYKAICSKGGGRKLNIHFSIPKDNPSEIDVNQGTLVVFNLGPSVTNRDLENIFGAYGEMKEIRETPNKRHHKFVEFFNDRSADAALKALNRTDISGKRIKLEHSCPGGVRRNMTLQMSLEFENDDSRSYLNLFDSPLARSHAGNQWGNNLIDHSPIQKLSTKAASMSNDQGRRGSHLDHLFSSGSSYNNNASHKSYSSSVWSINLFSLNGKAHRLPYSAQNKSTLEHHHVGYVLFGFFLRSPETSTIGLTFQGASGNVAQRKMR